MTLLNPDLSVVMLLLPGLLLAVSLVMLVRERRHVQALTQAVESWRNLAGERAVDLARLQAGMAAAEAQIEALRVAQMDSEAQLRQRTADCSTAQLELKAAQVQWRAEQQSFAEKLNLLKDSKQVLATEFENLANRIFDQKTQRLGEQSRTQLDALLNPLSLQLKEFRERVDHVYVTENQDRQALRSEIQSLQTLNRQITEEASSLTRALKGDKKIQGNWGELILEKVLEQSGLRKGQEYEVQGSYRDDHGQLFRPDVIVHLPDARHIIVDSKVSLLDYQLWLTAEDEDARRLALKKHVEAVRQHIRLLSDKDYSQLQGLRSPDMVLMFLPIEPAFIAAFQEDQSLFTEAFEHKVVVVTPTTLLATLRTVENIWRFERQSQNARKIADRAASVYDKLRVFLEHMERLGAQVNTLHKTYDDALSTLSQGRGNLVGQVQKFVAMGVRVKKPISRQLLDKAEFDEVDDGDGLNLSVTDAELEVDEADLKSD